MCSFPELCRNELYVLKAPFFCKSACLENPWGEFDPCSSFQLPWKNSVTGKCRNQVGNMTMPLCFLSHSTLNPSRSLFWEAGAKIILFGLLIEHQWSSYLFQTGDSGTGKCAMGRKDAQRWVLQSILNSFLTAKYCISWERMKTVSMWLPSTVSQLGGTKRNSPLSPTNQQKWVLFSPTMHSSNADSLLWDVWGQNINVVFRKWLIKLMGKQIL